MRQALRVFAQGDKTGVARPGCMTERWQLLYLDYRYLDGLALKRVRLRICTARECQAQQDTAQAVAHRVIPLFQAKYRSADVICDAL